MLSGYRPLIVLALILVAGGIVVARLRSEAGNSVSDARAAGCSEVASDYSNHVSGAWVDLYARVSRLLPDESGAHTHQRFIVHCSSGQTVLIVNDVSLGHRVPAEVGTMVAVRGQYVWNGLGGLVHFTHHATGGPGGWIAIGHHPYS